MAELSLQEAAQASQAQCCFKQLKQIFEVENIKKP